MVSVRTEKVEDIVYILKSAFKLKYTGKAFFYWTI